MTAAQMRSRSLLWFQAARLREARTPLELERASLGIVEARSRLHSRTVLIGNPSEQYWEQRR